MNLIVYTIFFYKKAEQLTLFISFNTHIIFRVSKYALIILFLLTSSVNQETAKLTSKMDMLAFSRELAS